MSAFSGSTKQNDRILGRIYFVLYIPVFISLMGGLDNILQDVLKVKNQML